MTKAVRALAARLASGANRGCTVPMMTVGVTEELLTTITESA